MKDTKFKPGKSGNPKGRPKGTRNPSTRLREEFLPLLPETIKHILEKVKAKDMAAIKLVLDRTIPPLKAQYETLEMDDLTGTLAEKIEQILAAATRGEISPDAGGVLIQSIAAQARVKETDELEARILALENQTKGNPNA